ncbi:YccF domain-containing protein [Saccharopolyspora sp. MS10]|uniref:YccF domain-containing protein n=1 Tax=Saccharopolyspora sp. MS10 TaxID=3385973 RepID=UPI0039A1FCA4
MQLLLNVIWLIFGGLWLALGYAVAGVVLAITVIGIPFAIASFRMANYALWPFGRRLVDEPGSGAFSAIGNVLWLLLAGWWLALGHILTGIAQCVTIIGIPLGIANFKLIPVSLFPLGKRIVDSDDRLPTRG